MATTCWIYAGGAHHTGFSQAITREHLEDFAEIAGLECLTIGADSKVSEFKKELRWERAGLRDQAGIKGFSRRRSAILRNSAFLTDFGLPAVPLAAMKQLMRCGSYG